MQRELKAVTASHHEAATNTPTGKAGHTQAEYSTSDPHLVNFLVHLHRAGRFAYWWTADVEGKRSYWWEVGKPGLIPKGRLNVYFGVHPTANKRNATQRARIVDVAAINCLFAEFDAKHFGADKAKALTHVESLPLAPSVLIDSGGGYHCYWLFAESFVITAKAARDRAQKAQAAWVQFVGGDQGAKDLARVLRVPGTRNYKPERGPDFPEVKFIRCDLDRLYSLESLEGAIPSLKESPRPANGPWPTSPTLSREERYAQAALEGELLKLRSAANGDRNNQLNRSAFALGQLIPPLKRSEVESALLSGALAIGLTESESLATIRSGLDAGEREPRNIPDNGNGRDNHLPEGNAATAAGEDPILTLIEQTTQSDERESALRRLFESLARLDPFTMLKYKSTAQEKLDISAKHFDLMIAEVKRSNLSASMAEVVNGQLSFDGQPLCNFQARITLELAHDDGFNPARLRLAVEGQLPTGERLPPLEVDAEDFEHLRWVGRWGARAYFLAKPTQRWLFIRALKELSQSTIKRETVYTFTGWHTVNGRPAYLTASGAISAEGLDPTVRVNLGDGQMQHYSLPEPPADPREAVHASLDFLSLAPLRVTAPLWAAMYTAPLPDTYSLNAVLWVYGKTQSRKSTLACLALTHFGRGFINGRQYKPPIDWEATYTTIEGAMFAAKSAPLLIDDYTPQQSKDEGTKQSGKAQKVIKAVGNRSYRGRSNADLTERAPRPPRGLVMSTAEEPITGAAVNGRMVYIPVAPGEVQLNQVLDRAQALAGKDGLYSQAMAAYLKWLASDEHKRISTMIAHDHEAATREGRAKLPSAQQGRLVDYYAVLFTGARNVLRFALEVNAINRARFDELTESISQALLDLLIAQADRVASQSPIIRTFEALHDLITQGKALLLRRRGMKSEVPERVTLAGWHDESETVLYLKTQVCLQLARDYWSRSNVNFDISADSFRRDMANTGLLAKRGEGAYECSIYLGKDFGRDWTLVVDANKLMDFTSFAFHPSQLLEGEE
jgi:hypothetical protein